MKQTKFNMLYYTDRGWDIAWCKTNGPLQMDLFLQFPTLQNLNIDLKSDQRSILELRIQIVRQKNPLLSLICREYELYRMMKSS